MPEMAAQNTGGLSPRAVNLAAPAFIGRAIFSSFLRAAFDEARAVHLGIDIQHKYCSPASGESTESIQRMGRIVSCIETFTDATRGAMTPIWVNHVNDNEDDWRVVPGQDTGLRAWGVRLAKAVGADPYSREEFARRDVFGRHAMKDDIVLSKPYFDGFEDTRLDDVLRARGADTLVLTGFFMDQCVMETALTARRKGYEVVMAADLSMAGSELTPEQALREMKHKGVRIYTAQDVTREARPWC